MDIHEMKTRVANLYNLTDIDSKWTFYYDETNNHRKFRLKDKGMIKGFKQTLGIRCGLNEKQAQKHRYSTGKYGN